MTESQEVTRALEAARVLDNEAYSEAMEALRTQITAQWKECPIRDREGQMLLLQLAKLTDKFEAILRGYVEAGKLAQHRIDINAARNESTVRRWIRRAA